MSGERTAPAVDLLGELLTDLRVESEELDGLVAGLPDAEWARPTPAPGWTIAHQIAHLAWTDELALLAARDPDGFTAAVGQAAGDPDVYVERAAAEGAERPPPQLLQRWRSGRAALHDALIAVPPGTRIVWFVTPMSPASVASARLMETWAHGLDVADSLGVRRAPTGRLRHVAHIGVRARDFAFRVNGRQPPAEPFRVELTGPAGELWTWGPPDAAQRVTGPALDFCLLATQRRHRDDLSLSATGPDADAWLDIAQAFAGMPGAGREPGAAGREPGQAG